MLPAISAARQGVSAIALVIIAVLAGSHGASAQAEDDRLRLFRYYMVHVAIDVCEIDVSEAHQTRFDRATDALERKTGATKDEMDGAFKQIKTGATQNPKGFCDHTRPIASKTLAEFE